MKNVMGIDFYNQVFTGGVAMTLRSKAGDSEHIPCVMFEENDGTENIQEDTQSAEQN